METSRMNILLRRCYERYGWVNLLPLRTTVRNETLPLVIARNGKPLEERVIYHYEKEFHQNRYDPPFVDLRRMEVEFDGLSYGETLRAVVNELGQRRFWMQPCDFAFDAQFYDTPARTYTVEFSVMRDIVPVGVFMATQWSFSGWELRNIIAPPDTIERRALDGLEREPQLKLNVAAYEFALRNWSLRSALARLQSRDAIERAAAEDRTALMQNTALYEQAMA